MLLRLSRFLLLLCSFTTFSQENYAVTSIPADLLDNANAVLRHSREDIVISSRNSMKVTEHRVVTVYNESGVGYMGAQAYFDKSTNVRSIEAFIYDKNGQQLKKFKRKDFKDVSVSSDAEITDNRVLYLDYTPVAYPFTVVFNCESESQNTAFIPMWTPTEGAFFSTQLSERNITVDPSLGFRYKEFNFTDVPLNKQQQGNVYSFKSENIAAVRNEDEAPSFSAVKPFVLFSLEKFYLEGVNGEVPDWGAMGKWMYTSLINGTEVLPQETVDKIKALTANETDPLKKARIVYKYVQGKTRYVSIQLGIGGWKPMLAKDVDRLGYGDCKALSNYTRALLKAVGVDSYCTVIYGGSNTRNLQKEFVSMQGNHMILAIPHEGNYVWLECTSQTNPFGHQGNFTDNRYALVIKPEGGEMVRTHTYLPADNTQVSVSDFTISPEGALTGSLKRTSAGLQYDDRFYLTRLSADELSKSYKKRFSHLNGLTLKKTDLKNDSDNILLTEELQVEVPSYGSNSGGRLIFAVNAFNQVSYVPVRYRSRKMPLEVDYGYTDSDEIIINLPEGYAVEAMPQSVSFAEKFGEYKAEYSMVDKNKILLKRTIKLNEGLYPKEDYEKYREFRDKIARNENAKAVLVKK
nr:DUF3857 domain-containing protein [uncultured Flavobacterium sp.]